MASPGAQLLAASSPRFQKCPTPGRIEVSLDSWKTARTMGEMITSSGQGAGLIIDYGDDRYFGNSLRVEYFDTSISCWLAYATPEIH